MIIYALKHQHQGWVPSPVFLHPPTPEQIQAVKLKWDSIHSKEGEIEVREVEIIEDETVPGYVFDTDLGYGQPAEHGIAEPGIPVADGVGLVDNSTAHTMPE